MDNTADKREEEVNSNEQLPLYSFFVLLKQNGFSVTPKQITDSNKIISRYANTVSNEAELCNYISPLFAQNEDEQKQFKELFDLHFGLQEKKSDIPPGTNRGKIVKHLKKHWWKYVTGIIVIIITGYIIDNISSGPEFIKPGVILVSENREKDFSGAFNVRPNEKFELLPQANNKLPDEETGVKLTAKYDWGDNSAIDTLPYHRYKKEGNYTIAAYVDVLVGKNRYADTAIAQVKVCSMDDTISINGLPEAGYEIAGRRTKLELRIKNRKPDRVIWNVNGTDMMGDSPLFIDTFETEGEYAISCTAVFDSINSPCTIQATEVLSVRDLNESIHTASISKSGGESVSVGPKHKIKSFWFFLVAGLLLLSYIFYTVFDRLSKQSKEKHVRRPARHIREKYNALVSSFSGNKPPFDLPFENKNYLPVPQQGLNELARGMRKRINDEATHLDLSKTIQKSISSGGLFQPVNTPRTRQSEYLVLIDEKQRNNQQVKLFEYLAEVLNRQTVHIEKYYYRDTIHLCYNISEPGGISLEKLSERYPRYALLIFGNAYELLSGYYPVFNYEYLQLLNRWKYKAVLTPVSFADWSSKEIKGLSPVIPVFPVDQEGLLLFIQTIFNEEQNIIPALYQQQRSFYAAEGKDFENIDELRAYCDKAGWAIVSKKGIKTNILFQWLAALAVYPKIKWEVTLATGKAILDKYGMTSELNYANLLRIARIKWMKDGQFPDYIRLELLKNLDKENEVIARETILSLLQEIPETVITRSHFAYEEKEIQRVINELNLYAYDPVKYAQYKESRSIFEQLWKEKKIQDSPAKVYFKNAGGWNTLFTIAGTDGERINTGIEKYLGIETAVFPERKFYQKAKTVWSAMFLVSLLGFFVLTGLNFFNNKKIPAITYQATSPAGIKFIYFNATGDVTFNSGSLMIDTITRNLENNREEIVQLMVNDSIRHITFNTGGKNILDTFLVINQDAYTISLGRSDSVTISTPVEVIVNFRLGVKCGGRMNEFEQTVKSIRPDLIVTYTLLNDDSVMQGNCLSRISFGKSVSTGLVDSLILNFKAVGFNLQKAIQTSAPPDDNKIDIYAEARAPVSPKPVIYIQYNNRQNLSQVQQLRSCLNRGIFNVPGIEYQANFSRNEIRYYSNSTKDSIALLQACLRSVYPGRTFYPVQVPIRHSNARAEIWVYDSVRPAQKPAIYVQISDDSLRASANNFKKELEGRGYTVNPVEIKSYPSNSQIYYFDQAMAAEARNILQYYSRYYPALPLKTQLINNFGGINKGVVVWIRKRDSPPDDNDNAIGKRIVSVAEKEVGYSEDPRGSNKTKYGKWFGLDGVDWSGIFVSWVYAEADRQLPPMDRKKGFGSFAAALNYFQKNKLVTNNPVAGDIVILRLASPVSQTNSGPSHGGIFIKWINEKEGTFETIEGNSNNAGGAEGTTVIKGVRNKNKNYTMFIHIRTDGK